MEFQCVSASYMGWDPNYTEIKSKLFSCLSFYPLTQTQKNYPLKGLCNYSYKCAASHEGKKEQKTKETKLK